MSKTVFVYNTLQGHLHRCQLRLRGMQVQQHTDSRESLALEIVRLQAAEQEIRSQMTDQEYNEQYAYENRQLTTAELAAEARAAIAAMDTNRDRVSH